MDKGEIIPPAPLIPIPLNFGETNESSVLQVFNHEHENNAKEERDEDNEFNSNNNNNNDDDKPSLKNPDITDFDPNARPDIFKSRSQELLAIFGLCLAQASQAAGAGSLQLAIPVIGRHFNISGGRLSWIVNAFILTSGAVILLSGKVADVIGRKQTLLGGYIISVIATLVGGFSKNEIFMSCFRAIQGIGAAASIPASIGILGACYASGTRKNKVFACYSASNPLGFVVGLIAGGIATQLISWRAAFWFQTILYAVGIVVVFFFVPVTEDQKNLNPDGLSVWNRLFKIDWVGAALIIVGLILITFALCQASNTSRGWRTPYMPVLLVLGVLFLVAFLFWESYVEDPLMPLYMWKYPNIGLALALLFIAFFVFAGNYMYYTSLFFQYVRLYSPLHTAAAFVPMVISGISVNVFIAFMMHRIPGQILLFVGLTAFMVSSLLMALTPIHLTYWAMIFPSLVIVVVGADLSYPVINMYVMESVARDKQGLAGGLMNTVIQIAGVIGLGVSSSIYDAVVGDATEPEIIIKGYRAAYWLSVGVAGFGCILTLFVRVGTQGSGEVKSQSANAISDQEKACDTNNNNNDDDEKRERMEV